MSNGCPLTMQECPNAALEANVQAMMQAIHALHEGTQAAVSQRLGSIRFCVSVNLQQVALPQAVARQPR